MQTVGDDGGCIDRQRFAIILFYGLVFWACYIAYALHMDIFGNDFGIFQILLAAPLILLARRDWEALAGAIAGGLAVVLAELASLGWGLWFDWLHALKEFPKAVVRANAYAGSVSPAGVASYFHLPALPFLALGIVAGALLLRKRARAAGPVELAGLVIIASALMSPYLLVYDTVAVLPFVIQRMLADDGRGRLPALAAFINPFAGIGLLWLGGALIAPLRQAKRKPEMAVSITSSL